jgi:TM2 domain-containing membrane protein YozV
MKKKSVAIFLALFVGGIGVHHFYLGNKGRGIIYMLLSWTLMPLIASFVDALVLMTLTPDQFHSFYNLSALPVHNMVPTAKDTGNVIQHDFTKEGKNSQHSEYNKYAA